MIMCSVGMAPTPRGEPSSMASKCRNEVPSDPHPPSLLVQNRFRSQYCACANSAPISGANIGGRLCLRELHSRLQHRAHLCIASISAGPFHRRVSHVDARRASALSRSTDSPADHPTSVWCPVVVVTRDCQNLVPFVIAHRPADRLHEWSMSSQSARLTPPFLPVLLHPRNRRSGQRATERRLLNNNTREKWLQSLHPVSGTCVALRLAAIFCCAHRENSRGNACFHIENPAAAHLSD